MEGLTFEGIDVHTYSNGCMYLNESETRTEWKEILLVMQKVARSKLSQSEWEKNVSWNEKGMCAPESGMLWTYINNFSQFIHFTL